MDLEEIIIEYSQLAHEAVMKIADINPHDIYTKKIEIGEDKANIIVDYMNYTIISKNINNIIRNHCAY